MTDKEDLSEDLSRAGLLAAEAGEAVKANGLHDAPTPSSSQRAIHLARRVGRALLPSFLNARTSTFDVKASAQHSATLYLDGLRGYASICVLNSHVVTAFTNAPQVDWGFGENENASPTSLPIVRLLFSGPGMVTLFFLVSGFSCSLKPLEAMASQDSNGHARAMKNLSSSLMRRWFRLYLPVLACTWLLTWFVHFGGFSLIPYYIIDENLLHPPHRFIFALPTIRQQFTFWFNDMYELLNLWHLWPNGEPDVAYYAPFSNPHMWFITVEFKASLILYCTLLATAVMRPNARFSVLAGFAFYMFFASKDEILPYFVGACLAHIKLTIDAFQPAPLPEDARAMSLSSRLANLTHAADRGRYHIGWNTLVIASLWLMSTPAWSFHGPSYFVFTILTPSSFVRQQTLLQMLGVAGLLLSLMTSSPESWLRRFLTHPLALYLGRISFAVYIVHGPVLLSIGYVVPVVIFRTVGAGPIGFLMAMVAAEAVTLVVSVWVADVFQREVEGRCLRLIRWMEAGVVGKG